MTTDQLLGLATIVVTPSIAFFVWLTNLGARVTNLETKMDVFWKAVSLDAAKILHSPDPLHRKLDELIEAYLAGELGKEEREEFVSELRRRRENTQALKGERLIAAMLLRTLEARYPELKDGTP